MRTDSHSVSIVVDRNYGPQLRDTLSAGPVWAVDSPANCEAAEMLWKEIPSKSHLDGLTIFDASTNRPAEQILVDSLDMVDLHHGVYSADPPYTVIRAYGTPLTAKIQAAMSEFGFDSFRQTDGGFEAVRPMPGPIEGNSAEFPGFPGPYRQFPISTNGAQ